MYDANYHMLYSNHEKIKIELGIEVGFWQLTWIQGKRQVRGDNQIETPTQLLLEALLQKWNTPANRMNT